MLPTRWKDIRAPRCPTGLIAAAVAAVAVGAGAGCNGDAARPTPDRPKTAPAGVSTEPVPGAAVAPGPGGAPRPAAPGAPGGGGEPGGGTGATATPPGGGPGAAPGAGPGTGAGAGANGNGQLLGSGPGENGTGTPARRMDYWLQRFRDYMTPEEVSRYLATPEERRFEVFGQKLLDYQRREALIEPFKERLARERPELLQEYYRLASYDEAKAFVDKHFGPGATGAGPRGS